MIGTTFDDRFHIESLLGSGSFGEVYRAVDRRDGVRVAIKVLHAELVGDPAIVTRFRREAAVLATLRHRHTLRAHELGETPAGQLYIVTELLHGASVDRLLHACGTVPWLEAVPIALAMCGSLAEAHARGILHRDLKPENVFICRGGLVKVLDFGIAKLLDPNVEHTQLTQVGMPIGTAEYMAPEQLRGEPCDARADIYAVGAMLYEMVAGVRPYPNVTSVMSLHAAMLNGPPPRLTSRAPVPAELDRVVMRCLEFKAHDRYARVVDLVAALTRLMSNHAAELRSKGLRDDDDAPTQRWSRPAVAGSDAASDQACEAKALGIVNVTAFATMFLVAFIAAGWL